MRPIVKILAVVGTSLVAVGGLFWTAQRRFIYFPTQAVGAASTVSADAEEATFTTDDGLTLTAWWIPASDTPNGSTILAFHGNGGNREDRAPLAQAFTERGYGVLLMDYRGYGGNPGSPSEEGFLLDADAAVVYLESRPEVDPAKLIYFGESLGAGVAIAVAQEHPPSALVLRSPFTSLPDVAKSHYPFLPTDLLLRDRYPNIDTIATLDVPTLVIAGSQDTIVPFSQSKELYEAAIGPKAFITIEGADHNDAALSHGPQMIEEVVSFLHEVTGT
ncbi:MAG: alpha/beta hydrolase [Actinomycetia bacterium]|nr:alpha/beta hydrolase [Actinomycetes bacterium]